MNKMFKNGTKKMFVQNTLACITVFHEVLIMIYFSCCTCAAPQKENTHDTAFS